MPLILSGSVDISGSMTATTIVVSSPGAAGMVSSSAQIRELVPLMAYTASLKSVAIVSSSQQIQNYNLFAVTSSANTFYGNITVDKSSPTLQLNAPTGTSGEYRLSNSVGTTHWSIYSTTGGGNSQGNWALYSAGRTGGAGSVIDITPAGAATFSSSIAAATGILSTTYNGGGTGMLHLTSNGTEGGTITFEKTSGTTQKYKFGLGTNNLFVYNETAGNQPFTITNGGQTQITGSFAVSGNSVLTGTLRTTSTNTLNGGTTYLGTTTFFRDDVSGPQNYGGSTIRVAGGTGTSAAGIQFGSVDSNATGARGRIGFLASANNGNPKEFAIIKGVLDSTGANTCDGSLRFHTLNGDNASEASLRMTIDGSGNIGATSGTNIYNASDIRLKQNISSISGSLNSVLLLNPVKFNWIDDFVPFENGKNMLGFVAQEVQTIVPEAVESFAADSIFVGETEIDNPLRVNEKFLIPVLTKAIQEQQAIIDGLIARIEALENN